ncbi:hypothetical protein RBWH47_01485 [Rhodopirellula baltica WH47]|uniref:Uncharacterized protein n=1 Tax=Rhodopirellula baltica WH47 TaxID=991778 RepID=F2AKS1_RHOBT|nr:hypothetical protein RBWH47_01485 [Rhodopirellula baltica WH47]
MFRTLQRLLERKRDWPREFGGTRRSLPIDLRRMIRRVHRQLLKWFAFNETLPHPLDFGHGVFANLAIYPEHRVRRFNFGNC